MGDSTQPKPLSFQEHCDQIMNHAEESREGKKALIRVAAQVLHDEDLTELATELMGLIEEFDELF